MNNFFRNDTTYLLKGKFELKKQTSIEDQFEDLDCFVKFVVIEQLSARFFLL